MIVTVELDSSAPIYQQIRDQVVVAIAEGRLAAGDRLPATRQLASDLGINFHTVNKAYDYLRAEGLITLGRRAGAVIARDPRSGQPSTEFWSGWEVRMRTILAEAIAHGATADEAVKRAARLAESIGKRES